MIEDYSLPQVRLSVRTAASNHFTSSITASHRAFIRMNFISSRAVIFLLNLKQIKLCIS